MNKQLLRDIQFMQMAQCVAQRSKCSSRQVGAVLVRKGSVVSEGFNGSPRGISLCQDRTEECMRRRLGYGSGEGLDKCPAAHAETNAIVQAARNGVETDGTTMYAFCVRPCKNCVILIINSGVIRLVYLQGEPYDTLSGILLEQSNIEYSTLGRELFDG